MNLFVNACVERSGRSIVANESQLVLQVTPTDTALDWPLFTAESSNADVASTTGAGVQPDGTIVLTPGATVSLDSSVNLGVMPAMTAKYEFLNSMYQAALSSLTAAFTPTEVLSFNSVTQCASHILAETRASKQIQFSSALLEDGYSTYKSCKRAASVVIDDGAKSIDEEKSGLSKFLNSVGDIVKGDTIEELLSIAGDIRG